MGKKPQATTMDKVRAAVLGSAGRGSLYRWLRQNHDEFLDLMDQVGRPDWTAITVALREESLLDAAGKPPTPERVRQTWGKVKSDVKVAKAKTAKANVSKQAVEQHLRSPAQDPEVQTRRPMEEIRSRIMPDVPTEDDLSASLDAGRQWRKPRGSK